MTSEVTHHSRRPFGDIKKLLVRSACGALVASTAWTSVGGVTFATPAPVSSPLLAQSLVGLRQGSSGDEVKSVQRALIAAGVPVPGGADGKFGPATRVAVLDFQARKGLAQSGEIDAATASALGLASTTGSSAAGGGAATPAAVNGLQQGAAGDAVKELQQKLIAAGVYLSGGADGQFGKGTKTAVSNYQRWNGLTVSGVVDAETAARLGLSGVPAAPATPPPVTPVVTPVVTPAVTPVAANPSVGLAVGARGALVSSLQKALIAAGIQVPGGADGAFGNATKKALAAYQQANGLPATGSVDAATAEKLGLGTTPTPPPPAPATPPPVTSTNPYVGLAPGARGDLVKQLQTALIRTGLVVRGGADGVFGNATKSALILFQRVNGLPETGVLDEKSAGILDLGTVAPPATPPAVPAPQPNGLVSTPDGFPKKGESGERVRVMQQLLIDLKISVGGGADGSFGNATAAAITKFQQANGLTVTGTITQETATKMGLLPSTATPPPAAGNVQLKRFPIQGQCYYGNTWHAARGSGRLHEGVDIIAAEGKLLYAVVDGTITKQYWDAPGALAGNGLRVAQDDGTYFTYLHMSGFAPGIKVGTKVTAGDVIGFVGNTGSSATAHLHFEIHPGGGAAVNPYPYVKAIDDCGNTTPQYQSSFAS